jgi:cytochrome c oxidase assembly protein subunit 15
MTIWMETPWLHRFAVALAVCTLFLVVAGASVTSNQAGLSVPDWPLSYGKVMPAMTGGVFYEHGHRMVATTVGFMTVILVIWLWRVEKRKWMKVLGLVSLAAVIVQGVLGGMTVKFMLPKPVSVSHACLAQLFFSATVAIAIFTSPNWKRGPLYVEDSGWPSMRSLSLLTAILVLVQVALGAGYRHRAFDVMPHIIGSIFVTAFILLVSIFILAQFGSHPALKRAALALLLVTCIQVLLGIAAFMSGLSHQQATTPVTQTVLLTVTHVAAGALTLAASVSLCILVFRNVRPKLSLATSNMPAVSR